MSIVPDISIIIVSYNVKDLLIKCISSIYKFELDAFSIEIIVVDNNSNDRSADEISIIFPKVKLIRNKFNAGFSTGNNQGLKMGTGKFIFLLNPDTEFRSDVLSGLTKEISTDTNIIIAPKLLNTNGSLQVSCFKFPGLLPVIAETFYLHRIFGINNYPHKLFNDKFYPDWSSGAALFFSRNIFNRVGPLDENLFWMDDVDFCYRASKNGIRILFYPNVELFHHSGKSSQKNLSVSISNQLLSKIKYFSKHKGKDVAFLASIFILVQILSRVIIFLILSPLNNLYRVKLMAYIFAIKKYFRFVFLNDKTII